MELDKQRKNGIISIGSDTVYLGREKEDANGNRMDGPLSAAVAELVRHSNITQRLSATRFSVADDICLNSQEWQVFEYILEHSDDDAYMNMNMISERLGIAQSTFSKSLRRCVRMGW